MRFTPRGDEIGRVLEILESDDYATGEDMAKALIREVVDMLWFRDWWTLAAYVEGAPQERGQSTLMWGPFAMDLEARSAGQKWAGMLVPPEKWAVLKMRGLGGTAEERAGGGFGFCTNDCGHPAYAHSMAGTSRGGCVLCGCEKYEQVKPKKRTRKLEVVAA